MSTPGTWPVRLRTVLLAMSASWLIGCSAADEADSSRDDGNSFRLPVQATEVRPRDLSRTVQVSANVEAFRVIRLAAQADGVLSEVNVDAGEQVDNGAVLARIDVREQQAELRRARSRLDERESTLARMQLLEQDGFIDSGSLDTARAERDIAAAEVELWQTRVDFGTVKVRQPGTVLARHIEPGEAVNRHDVLFEIADLSDLVLRVGISELDMGQLQVGDPVQVRVDAMGPDGTLDGEIRRIFPAAEQRSRLVQVEIALPDAAEAGIRPGYLARARLDVDRRPDRLAVPAPALADSNGDHYVMLINDDDELERRTLEAGVTRNNWREVLSGLEAGDRVVASNPLDLREGTRVRIVGWTE